MSEQTQGGEPPNIRELLQTIETNGLIVQHKLQSSIELVLGGCINWNPGEGKTPTYDFNDEDEQLIETLARSYYLVAAADAARLNSYKPPVNNFFYPKKTEEIKPPIAHPSGVGGSLTPFPYPDAPGL